MFKNGAEFQRLGLWAELFERHPGVGVLGGENGLPGSDKRRHAVTPILVKAIFSQRPFEVGQQVGHLLVVVLQPDRQPAGVGFVGQPGVVGYLVLVSQREAGVGGVAVNVVRLDGIEPLGPALVQPGAAS